VVLKLKADLDYIKRGYAEARDESRDSAGDDDLRTRALCFYDQHELDNISRVSYLIA
jgi:hypothetical protein